MKVRPNPDGTFTADMRVRTKGPQVKFDTEEEANLAISRARVERADKSGIEAGRTLQEAVDLYLDNCRLNEFSEFTLDSYERWTRNHVVKHLPKYLSQIDFDTVVGFRALDRSSMTESTRSMPMFLLDCILDEAVGEEWLDENPIQRLPEIRRRTLYNRPRNHVRLRLPTDEEFKACLGRSTGVLRIILCLAGLAGLRLGEILALRRADVDLKGRNLQIRSASKKSGAKKGRKGATKTDSSYRGVPISRHLLGVLEDLLGDMAPDQLICIDAEGQPIGRDEAYAMLKKHLRRLRIVRWRASIRANIAAYGFHAFRHACVSRWLHANIPLATIMRWIGHSHPQTTVDIYAYQIRSAVMQSHGGKTFIAHPVGAVAIAGAPTTIRPSIYCSGDAAAAPDQS